MKGKRRKRKATRAGCGPAMGKPSRTPNEKDNQEWEKQWEKDSQEWEAIKRDYQTYKSRLQKLEDLFALRAAYNIGKLKGDSRRLAQLAATNLEDGRWLILQRAEKGDVPFFVALGECLKGRIKPYKADPRDMAILELVWDNRSISDNELVYALKRRGFEITPGKRARDMIRSRLLRIRGALPDEWKSKIPKRKSKSEISNPSKG